MGFLTWLEPRTSGVVTIRSTSTAFIRALEQRVAAGLLTGEPRRRSRYQVIESTPRSLRIRAADWIAAVNVGLNDVELIFSEPRAIRYQVTYWRWAQYVIGLSGVMGLIGLVLLGTADVRGYMARNPSTTLMGLSADQGLALAWAMVLFWGFAWPWLLIALHKRPLRRLLERLVGEVDAAAVER